MARRLGELLMEQGLIAAGQLREALRTQQIFAGSLGTHLVQLGYVSENDLGGALSELYDVPPASRDSLNDASASVLRLLPAELAHGNRAIPFRREGGTLHVAMQHPLDASLVEELASSCGLDVVPHVAPEVVIQDVLSAVYPEHGGTSGQLILDTPASSSSDSPDDESARSSIERAGTGLSEAGNREQVVDVALTALREHFTRVAAFAIRDKGAVLWRSAGFGALSEEREERVHLDSETLLSHAVASDERVVVGKATDAETSALYRVLGVVAPEGGAVVFVVRLLHRPVMAFLADGPTAGSVDRLATSLAPLSGIVAMALEVVVLRGKILRQSAN